MIVGLAYLDNARDCYWIGDNHHGAAPIYRPTISVEFDAPAMMPTHQLLEVVFSAFNRHDAADQHEALDRLGLRSLSVGDVVILGDWAYTVASCGFTEVLDPLVFAS